MELMRNLKIGFWSLEYEEGLEPRMYGDETMLELLGIEGPCSPEEVYHAWYDNIDKEHYGKIHEAIEKMEEGIDTEVQYPWHCQNGQTIMVRGGGRRDQSYEKGLRIEGMHRDVTQLVHLEKNNCVLNQSEEYASAFDGCVGTYNLAYKVNMAEDSFRILRIDNDLHKENMTFTSFSQLKDYALKNVIAAEYRDIMRDELDFTTIRRKIAQRTSYMVEFKGDLGTEASWCLMNVIAVDKDTVAIGFSKVNRDIILKHLSEQSYSEYIGLYSIDFDKQEITVIKSSPYYYLGPVGTTLPYQETVETFAQAFGGTERKFFDKILDINFAKENFAKEDQFTYNYRSGYVGGGKTIVVTGYVAIRHPDGTPAIFTMGFSLLDALQSDRQELLNKIARQSVFTNLFLEPYLSTFYIDLKDYSCRIFKSSAYLTKRYEKIDNYLKVIHEYIEENVHPDDAEMVREAIEPRIVEERLNEENDYQVDFRVLSQEGEKIYRIHVIRGADDEHVAIGFRDITKQVTLRRQERGHLEEALHMAQSANRAKTAFLNSMSHDIRTPMNAIMGFTKLAKSHIDDKTQTSDYLEKISQSSGHLLELINEVLDMSRIESGKMKLEENSVNLLELIEKLRNLVEGDIMKKGHNLTIETEGIKNPRVLCDRVRLNQILINILSNAIKYTPNGGNILFKVTERDTENKDDSSYEFIVKDNGIGMSEEFLVHIYEPFQREYNSTISEVEGTGLGMPIAKNIIDLMGGRIEIQSKLDQGTQVRVIVNFKLQTDDAFEIEEEQENKGKEIEFRGKKVLVVEDNEFNREITTELLEEFGFITEIAENGEIALNIVKEKGTDYYDFILMDIQMPVMDGYEATKAIRQLPGGDEISIIALSANTFVEDINKSISVGMNSHIAKPIDIKVLTETLSKYNK